MTNQIASCDKLSVFVAEWGMVDIILLWFLRGFWHCFSNFSAYSNEHIWATRQKNTGEVLGLREQL